MTENNFENKINELILQFGSLPKSNKSRLESIKRKIKGSDSQEQIKLQETIDGIQDSLDYLRVSIKYLLFDLEATRRENDYLKRVIESKNDSE